MINNITFNRWQKLNETPYYFFYYYVPTRYGNVSYESINVRTLIWNFKDGRNQNEIVKILEKKLKNDFRDLSSFVFVCIPASKRMTNDIRYKNFSRSLCEKLNMNNAFDHISIVKEKEPKHLGGSSSATYEFDKDFFRGKHAILFDDVVTRGSSMQSFISYLEESGAKTACCISIGKTYWEKTMPDSIRNPWTGKYVFSNHADDEVAMAIVPENKIDITFAKHKKVLPDIMEAIIAGRIDEVKSYVLDKGDIEVKDKYDRTPLIRAVIKGDLEIVRLLVDNSADVEYCWNGVTPLYLAAQNNYKEIFEYLCENDVNINVVDDTGMSIRELCVKRGYNEIIGILNRFDKRYDSIFVNMIYNVGDTITLGKYQNRKLDWTILDKNEGNGIYLLISKYGIECMRFYGVRNYVSWDKSNIRRWLNNDFLEGSFSDDERDKIIVSKYEANENPVYRSNQGSHTFDKISILDITQYNKYFDMYNRWECKLFSGTMRQCWLRNSGNDNYHAAFIGRSGSIHAGGSYVDSPRNAVRPIMWVKL